MYGQSHLIKPLIYTSTHIYSFCRAIASYLKVVWPKYIHTVVVSRGVRYMYMQLIHKYPNAHPEKFC